MGSQRMGNYSLAFGDEVNLWVFQDGFNNYIWVGRQGHVQDNPKTKIIGIALSGSEPPGITLTPGFKYLFMSFQGSDKNNNITEQLDAAGNNVKFDNHVSLVIALRENRGIGE